MNKDRLSSLLCWLGVVLNGLYKLGFLAALVWIGYGLQSIAIAISSGTDACIVDPDASADDPRGDQPQLLKPLFRGDRLPTL